MSLKKILSIAISTLAAAISANAAFVVAQDDQSPDFTQPENRWAIVVDSAQDSNSSNWKALTDQLGKSGFDGGQILLYANADPNLDDAKVKYCGKATKEALLELFVFLQNPTTFSEKDKTEKSLKAKNLRLSKNYDCEVQFYLAAPGCSLKDKNGDEHQIVFTSDANIKDQDLVNVATFEDLQANNKFNDWYLDVDEFRRALKEPADANERSIERILFVGNFTSIAPTTRAAGAKTPQPDVNLQKTLDELVKQPAKTRSADAPETVGDSSSDADVPQTEYASEDEDESNELEPEVEENDDSELTGNSEDETRQKTSDVVRYYHAFILVKNETPDSTRVDNFYSALVNGLKGFADVNGGNFDKVVDAYELCNYFAVVGKENDSSRKPLSQASGNGVFPLAKHNVEPKLNPELFEDIAKSFYDKENKPIQDHARKLAEKYRAKSGATSQKLTPSAQNVDNMNR